MHQTTNRPALLVSMTKNCISYIFQKKTFCFSLNVEHICSERYILLVNTEPHCCHALDVGIFFQVLFTRFCGSKNGKVFYISYFHVLVIISNLNHIL